MDKFLEWAVRKGLAVAKAPYEPMRFYYGVTQIAWEAYQLGTKQPYHDPKIIEGEKVLLTNV
jgi:hypothetical protein